MEKNAPNLRRKGGKSNWAFVFGNGNGESDMGVVLFLTALSIQTASLHGVKAPMEGVEEESNVPDVFMDTKSLRYAIHYRLYRTAIRRDRAYRNVASDRNARQKKKYSKGCRHLQMFDTNLHTRNSLGEQDPWCELW
jgi:hypothetical protein